MEIKYLKRKEKDYIYAATEELMKHEDLHPCDKHGNLLGISKGPQPAGLNPKPPEPQGPSEAVIGNIMRSLNVPYDVAESIANGTINAPSEKSTAENNQDKIDAEFSDPLDDMKATPMVEYAKEKFGERADHLYIAMGTKKLKAEIERLGAE